MCPKMTVFWLNILIILGGSNIYQKTTQEAKLLVPSYRGTYQTPALCENIDWRGSNGSLETKKCNFDPKILIFGTKSKSLFWNRDFWSKRHTKNTPGPSPKKISTPNFPGLIPDFGHFGPLPNCQYKYPLFWTVVKETWLDRTGHQKMTFIDNAPSPGRNYGETTVFTFD